MASKRPYCIHVLYPWKHSVRHVVLLNGLTFGERPVRGFATLFLLVIAASAASNLASSPRHTKNTYYTTMKKKKKYSVPKAFRRCYFSKLGSVSSRATIELETYQL